MMGKTLKQKVNLFDRNLVSSIMSRWGNGMAKIKFEPDTRSWQEKLNEVWRARTERDWFVMCGLEISVRQWKEWEIAMHRPISRAEIISLLTEIFSGNVEVRIK
jgi:hypothetical protein